MRKQKTHRGKSARPTRIAMSATLAAMAVSAALAGCSPKAGPPAALGIETEAPMELNLSCYLTGITTFNDAGGKEQTSVRFLVENNDRVNKDWVRGINGKECLKVGEEEVQIYSRYVNDHCRYVEGIIPGNVQAEDVVYTAGNFACGGWKQMGEGQYREIGAIVDEGIPYFYTGCGVSTGLAGERVMCVWLAGFTPDSASVDGARPQLARADKFSLTTADGGDIPAWEGMAKEPELSVNEFGVEVTIQAEDADVLMRSISRTGLSLRHKSEDGTVSAFELEKKIQESITENEQGDAGITGDAGNAEDGEVPEDTAAPETGDGVGDSAEDTQGVENMDNGGNIEKRPGGGSEGQS